MGAGLCRCDVRQLIERRGAKRATGGGEHDAAHADALQVGLKITRQTLKYGVVLAVDRQQHGAVCAHLVHEQLARHHQRFLVGEQHAFARTYRSERGQQTGSPHDGGHHGVGLRQRGNGFEAALPGQHLDPGRVVP